MSEPTRPGEIPHSMPLAELVGQVERHGGALFEHWADVAPLPDAERAGHALAELAYSAALAERTVSGRWVVACEALDAGASHAQVADAMSLDVSQLRAGLRSWARQQLRQGLIDDTRHARVLALLGEQPAGELPTWVLRRLETLLDALGDPPLSLAERASLVVLARQEQVTVEHLAAVIRRARGVEL